MRHVADRASFMKIMIHDYKHRLEVPPQFVKHLGGRPMGEYQMRVWGSAGSYCWIVKVERDGAEYCFKNGWPEFVEDNDLGFGDVLVFGYEEKFKFFVKVFAPSGLKRNMPSLRGEEEEEEEVAVETPLQNDRESEDGMNMPMDFDEQPIFYVNEEGECHVGAGGKRVKVSVETSQEESLCYMEVGGEKETEGHGCTESTQKRNVSCSDMKGQCKVELTRKESLFWFEDKAKESIEERIAPPLSSDCSRFIATWSSTWQHYMTIPKEIAVEKDLYSKSQLVVRDSKEKLWFMKLSTAEDGSVNLTEKWASFYESHSLKEGDSCVFEFIGSRIVHVQIIPASSVKFHAGVEDVLLGD